MLGVDAGRQKSELCLFVVEYFDVFPNKCCDHGKDSSLCGEDSARLVGGALEQS